MARLTGWKARVLLVRIFLILGTVFFLVSLGSAFYELTFLAFSERTQGFVLRNVETLHSISSPSPTDKTSSVTTTSTVFCPEIQYTSADGLKHAFTSKACSFPPTFAQGQQISVLYVKSHPDYAQTDSLGAKWGIAIAFAIPALLLLPVAFVLLWLLRADGHRFTFFDSLEGP